MRRKYICTQCRIEEHDRRLDNGFLVCVEENPGPRKEGKTTRPPKGKQEVSGAQRRPPKGGRNSGAVVQAALVQEVSRLKGELEGKSEVVTETCSTTEAPKLPDPKREINEELGLRRLQRDLDGDYSKFDAPPFGSDGGGGDVPRVPGMTSGDIFRLLLEGELFGERPYAVICEIPRIDYDKVLPSEFGDRTGFLESVVSWWRDEIHPLVRDVFYIGVLCGLVDVEDTRPMDDREEVFRDYSYYVIQPAIRIRFHDGSEHYSVTSKWPASWLATFTLGAWFPPAPFDFIKEPPHVRFPLETVPIKDPSDQHRLGDFCIGDVAVKMQPYYVSCYALQTFYQRRTLLTPQLDRSIAMKRMVRMYSEDPRVNSFLDVKIKTGRCVLTDTLNFLLTLAFGDLESPIESF